MKSKSIFDMLRSIPSLFRSLPKPLGSVLTRIVLIVLVALVLVGLIALAISVFTVH